MMIFELPPDRLGALEKVLVDGGPLCKSIACSLANNPYRLSVPVFDDADAAGLMDFRSSGHSSMTLGIPYAFDIFSPLSTPFYLFCESFIFRGEEFDTDAEAVLEFNERMYFFVSVRSVEELEHIAFYYSGVVPMPCLVFPQGSNAVSSIEVLDLSKLRSLVDQALGFFVEIYDGETYIVGVKSKRSMMPSIR